MIKLPISFRVGKRIDLMDYLGIICLIPFFQPGCIDSFILYGINTTFFTLLGKFFTALRMLISIFTIFIFLLNINRIKKRTNKWVFTLLLLNVLLVALSGLINSARITVMLSYLYDVGVLCLFELLIYRRKNFFLNAIIYLFGALSWIGAISVILFPNGFNHAHDIHNAIYFLGSKNASINVYIVFLMSLWGKSIYEGKELPSRSIIYLAVFFLTGVMMGSGSTIVCVLGLTCIFVNYRILRGKIVISPIIPFSIVIIIVVIIYLGSSFQFILDVLEWIGRDTTFSGRTTLWKQAIKYYNQNILFGSGMDIVYRNFSGTIQYSAHSQFLDRLAKYGLIPFLAFCASILYMEKQLVFSKGKKISSMLGLFIALYILRMGFDVYSLYYIFTIAYLCNVFVGNKDDKMSNNMSSLISLLGVEP